MPEDKENLARLVQLEEERAKREKAKEFSEGLSALGWLLIFGVVIYLVWQFWTAFTA